MFEWISNSESLIQKQSIEEKEEEFNNVVRENIIALLTFILLYIFSYFVISRFHQKKEQDGLYGGDEDAQAYRISFYLCTFTLSVSCGAVLMLPMSMVGNEVVHLYPNSYWVQWLNGALIHTFWQWIFVFSNISLFALLPFSYFFTESEGFTGQRRGLMPRVHETFIVLFLLAILVFGFAVLILAFFDNSDSAQEILMIVGEYYLQYLYSFLLCVCVLFMVAACAPIGFITLFDAVGHLLVKPKIFENNDEKIVTERLEEEAIEQKLKSKHYLKHNSEEDCISLRKNLASVRKARLKHERRRNASAFERNLGYPVVMLLLVALTGFALCFALLHILKLVVIGDKELHPSTAREEYGKDYRKYHVVKTCSKTEEPEQPSNAFFRPWNLWRNAEVEKPPETEQCTEEPDAITSVKSHLHSLGAASLSTFGFVGTLVDAFLIFYLMLASVIGLYNLPGFRLLRPEEHDTTMTKIIMNCLALQLLSSSLPVMSRVLGFTNFELQGSFGKFNWLGEFYAIFALNVIFAAVTAFCLVSKVTAKVRRELYKAFQLNREAIARFSSPHSRPPSSTTSPAVKLASQRKSETSPRPSTSGKESHTEPSVQKMVSSIEEKVQQSLLDKSAVLYPPTRTAS